MKVIGKDRTSCDVCNPIDEILARLDSLERRASAIVAKVQGIAPDGEGNVTLPTSSSDTDPLHGRVDAFAMSSEVKEAADDAHAYAASIADDVLVINSEIDALNQAVAALQPAEIEAIKAAVQTLQATVATLESAVTALNNSVAGKVSKSGDTMSGNLEIVTDINKTYRIKRNNLDRSVEPSYPASGDSDVQTLVTLLDKNNSSAAYVERSVRAEGTVLSHVINQTANGSIRNHQLNQVIGVDGSRYVTIPSWSPGTNDNSDKILTIKMANSLPSLVHTTGNETIAGIKTFSSSPIVPSTPSGATGTEIATANWVMTKINELATKNKLTGL